MIQLIFKKNVKLRRDLHLALAGWQPYIDSEVALGEEDDKLILTVGPLNGKEITIHLDGLDFGETDS